MDFKRRDVPLGTTGVATAWATGLALPTPAVAQTHQPPSKWDREADIVVIGAGATGLPAAIVAREAGSSVILVEAEKDIGGHAITSAGNVPLGGGTSVQKKHGIEDSPDLLFRDLTDWSVVGPNGFPDYRYNDREIIRAFADNSALRDRSPGARAVIWQRGCMRRVVSTPNPYAGSMFCATPVSSNQNPAE